MNDELRSLFEADQQIRRECPDYGTAEYAAAVAEDRRRGDRAAEIVAAGALEAPEDYYRAAMLLQHSYDVARVATARELALRAAELGCAPARWLAAAALDRWLMYQGRPQKYGTQVITDGSRWRRWDTDPTTTDADRAAWDVDSFAQQDRSVEEWNREVPPSPPEKGPAWLKQILDGWYI